MRKFFKEYHMDDSLTAYMSGLEEVICNRQAKYSKTVEGKEAHDELNTCLDKVRLLLPEVPESKQLIGKLEDAILTIECIYFSAAYRDGISDLISSMTFNNLGITKVEHYDLSKGA